MSTLIVFAVLLALAGLALASQATIGVALIGVACVVAILARVAQAQQHYKTSPGYVSRDDADRARRAQQLAKE